MVSRPTRCSRGPPFDIEYLLIDTGSENTQSTAGWFAVKSQSLPWQLAGGAASLAVYLGVLWLVGAFAREEIATAREGIAFFRPLLAHWSTTLRKKT